MTRDTLSHWLTHPAVGVVATSPDAGVSAVVVVAGSAVAAVAVQVALSVVSVESVEHCSSRRGLLKFTCSIRSRAGSSRSSCRSVPLVWVWDWLKRRPLGNSGELTGSRGTGSW